MTCMPLPQAALKFVERPARPPIVCLCGSTRFWREFQWASLRETIEGRIVLSIGAASGTDDETFSRLSRDEYHALKARLDELHLRKIDLADEVLILNVGGYIGESVRRSLLAQVHLAKRDFGLEGDDYRDALEAIVPGKRSAADMTLGELDRVLSTFRQRGWQADLRPNSRRRGGKFQPSAKPHVRKVWALWGAMGREGVVAEPSRAALRTFVERMTKCTDPEWLSPEQANIVIEALKAWKRRHQGGCRGD